eukprot:14201802-Alexandrium_andersonii.AAC.2
MSIAYSKGHIQSALTQSRSATCDVHHRPPARGRAAQPMLDVLQMGVKTQTSLDFGAEPGGLQKRQGPGS